MHCTFQHTARSRLWAGLFAALLMACGLMQPTPAHADLSSLIKELQQCQRSGQQLRTCEQQKTAISRNLRRQIAILQARVRAQAQQIRKYQKKLGIKPTARPLSDLANMAGAQSKRINFSISSKDASYGPKDAKVTIVEFSDFQCPFCNRGAKTIDQIKKAYKGKVRIVFKHLPLNFHNNAHLAAQASLAAKAQGKFWAFHDKMFANHRNLGKANLLKWAKELGLDTSKFKAALDNGTYKAQVDADLQLARRSGANGTPTFFINGRMLVGARPFGSFKEIIDQEIKLADALLQNGTPANRLMQDLIKLSKTPAPTVDAQPTSAGGDKSDKTGSPTLGPDGAKVTIIEFSDFQCPFCNRGAKTMKQIVKAYGDKVKIVFKHNPLSFHRQAHLAAQASMAAHAQGKFWEYHDKLFANYRNINKANLLKWAKELGLDADKFKSALDSGKYKAKVDADLALGRRMGVRGTPNFFVNGQKVAGAYPFSHFKGIIDALLSGKKPTQPIRKPSGPKAKPTVGNAPSIGPKNAKVTIIEYSDFQCPFCKRGAATMKQLLSDYKGKLRLVFKHRPLSFHRNAHLAAQASMAAHEQGKFWAFHDKLFANNRSLGKANYIKWAKELGLDTDKFQKALDSGKFKSYVDSNNREAVKVGAGGTPTFFINGQKVVGAQPISRFKAVIDGLLSGKKPVAAPRPTPPTPTNGHNHKHTRVLVKINDNDASFGPTDAPITIVEFSDFQCPFCSRGAKVMDQVKDEFKGKVRIVFKHLPLPFHRQAHIAAQASLAAKAQGKFWEYHDKLFANQRNINKANLVKWAKELGLDADKFQKALDSGTYKAQVDRDLGYSRQVGARGTPNFFVNGRKVAGAYPLSHFKRLINEELRHVAQLRKQGVPAGKIYDKLMESAKDAAAAERIKKMREAQAAKAALAKVNLENAPSFGPKDAKVTIISFSDFQCPFCARGARTIDQIKKAYKGKVRIVFKHLPLSFHRQAHIAAQASMAAHEQGKFWAFHDKLFANYRNLSKDNFVKWAKELGLDADKFQKALDNGKFKAYVDKDLAISRGLGARGTPTFFINGQKVVGAQPFSRFKAVIDQELKK